MSSYTCAWFQSTNICYPLYSWKLFAFFLYDIFLRKQDPVKIEICYSFRDNGINVSLLCTLTFQVSIYVIIGFINEPNNTSNKMQILGKEYWKIIPLMGFDRKYWIYILTRVTLDKGYSIYEDYSSIWNLYRKRNANLTKL